MRFDETALRYVESVNGDYLPDDSFFVPPVVEDNSVTLGTTSFAESSSGDGTLATLTFEFIAVKESTVTLSETNLVNSAGGHLPYLFAGEYLSHLFRNSKTVVGIPHLREDVNLDGVVNILDLVLVASKFGQTVSGDPADVNEDGVVNIVDLVKVAGALGGGAAAPSALYSDLEAMPTRATVQKWLSQAQQLNLTDATSQRGILFLEQLLASLTPKETALLPNYPNPFNPETWIPYQLAKPADVSQFCKDSI